MAMPMPNMNPQAILQQMMQRNPEMMNNPQAQNMINILMNGDSKAGEQMAMNLCQSMGVSKEDAMRQAQSFFSQMMGGRR